MDGIVSLRVAHHIERCPVMRFSIPLQLVWRGENEKFALWDVTYKHYHAVYQGRVF